MAKTTLKDGSTWEYGIGSYLMLEGKTCGELLLEGDEPVDEGYKGSEYRYPTPHLCNIPSLPINVEITGRTIQYKNGAAMMKCRVEWVGDCEESTFCSGWIKVHWIKEEGVWHG